MFNKKIVASARDIVCSCVADPSFRQIFDDQGQSIRKKLGDSSCDSMRQLRTAFNDLQDAVKPWHQAFENQHDHLFTLVFDEVGSLMKDGEHGRFIALNRMISVLSKGNVWFLFLSTESRLYKLLPPDRTIKRARWAPGVWRAAALAERDKEIEAESSHEPESKLKKRKRGN